MGEIDSPLDFVPQIFSAKLLKTALKPSAFNRFVQHGRTASELSFDPISGSLMQAPRRMVPAPLSVSKWHKQQAELKGT